MMIRHRISRTVGALIVFILIAMLSICIVATNPLNLLGSTPSGQKHEIIRNGSDGIETTPHRTKKSIRPESATGTSGGNHHKRGSLLIDDHDVFDDIGLASRLNLKLDQVNAINSEVTRVSDVLIGEFFDYATTETLPDGGEILVLPGSQERADRLAADLEAAISACVANHPERERVVEAVLNAMKKGFGCLGSGDMLGLDESFPVILDHVSRESATKCRWKIVAKGSGYIEHSRSNGWPSKETLSISNGAPIMLGY